MLTSCIKSIVLPSLAKETAGRCVDIQASHGAESRLETGRPTSSTHVRSTSKGILGSVSRLVPYPSAFL